jgi:putative hemolysin
MMICRHRISGQMRLDGSIFQLILSERYQDGIASSIPATGRVLAIANHPYGVIDGLVLCALMAEVRQDYKIITHRVLRQAPAVMDKILPVDFDETEAALANNLKTRADAAKHLKNGGAVIVFPGWRNFAGA